jgi:DNA invertase Pin-like site-specific DNA recombinase
MAIFGYARVSTDGQSLDAQVKQLRAAKAEKVFKETASGGKTDRAQLRRVLGQLAKCAMLTVTRLDRLARSTRECLLQNRRSRVPCVHVLCLDAHDAALRPPRRGGDARRG